jgi:hypothetical protein
MIAAMRRTATLLAAALLLPSPLLPPVPALAQPVDDSIGTWRLSCATDCMTDRSTCRMLYARPVERSEPGRPALALEVVERAGRLVPAVTARNLTMEGAARGLLALSGTAQLRFPPSRLFEMPCDLEGRSLVCVPRPEDRARAEAELPAAERVLVRMQGLAGTNAEPVELPLARTAEALARLRQEAPPGTLEPPESPAFDGRDLLQRLFRLFGQ